MNRRLLSKRFARAAAPAIQSRLNESQLSKVKSFELDLGKSRLSLVHEGCPCGAEDDVTVAEVDRYGLPLTTVLCKHCGTLRTNPYLDSTSLDSFYRETYLALYGWAPVMEDYFARQFSYGERVLALYERELPSSANILEIGCGAGGALSVFQGRGHRVAGCDLGRDLIDYGTYKGVDNLWNGTLNEVPEGLACQRFDLIYLHHVFEHMASPCETLQALSKMLTTRGKMLVIVPDITRVDRFPIPAGDILQFLHVGHKFNYTLDCLDSVAVQTALTAMCRTAPAHIMTSWSQMPELWVEFRAAAAVGGAWSPGRLAGHRVLRNLLKIERRFLAGKHATPAIIPDEEASAAPSQPMAIKKIWHRFRRKDAA